MRILQKPMKKLKIAVLTMALLLIFAELSPQFPVEMSTRWSPHSEPSLRLTPLGFILGGSMAAEVPEVVYYGDIGAAAVLGNLGYVDVAGVNVWSREAIYETGALGIVKGFDSTNKRFGRTVPLTKEEAMAIVYRAAGREDEAQLLGVAINNARAAASKKTDPLAVWYDGVLQLAANEGLISARDLADAFNADQTTLTTDSFKRKGSAQRQEIAFWLARTLNIQPVGQQQELLNYTDWRSTDPDKLGYMEAILQQGIMTGSGGRINPKQSITREQGAQVVKNAESTVLEALKYVKNSGTVDNITITKDYTGSIAVSGKNVTIRNNDGKNASILTSIPAGTSSGAKNENVGTPSTSQKRELVVYKNGTIGNSNLLKTGDRLQYITDSTNTVKYINVISNVDDVRYIAAQINNVDRENLLMNVTQLFKMDFPDLKSITGDVSFSGSLNEITSYRIAAGATISVNGVKAALTEVTDDATAILTIGSNNIIKEIQCVDLGINSEARRIVRGIVEENNPDLGYLTLYNENGSGVVSGNAAVLRTYNYVDQNKTAIYRNHKAVKADSIQTGDTAYIKLDNDGNIASVSSVDNYTVKYARVVSKLPAEIAVEFEDGTQQLLATGNNIIVVRDKLLVGLKALKDGDRVKLLLNDNGKTTDLKEITIEGDEHFISNIYKGTITKIDDMSDKITVMGLQVFNKGNWERTDRKGVTTIPLADSFNIYSTETVLDIENANKLLYSNEAYIAVEKSYGGEEEAVLLSYRNSLDTQVPTSSDSIAGVISGSGSFMLSRDNQKVNYFTSSIVVKYGRLVSGNSLTDNDKAYLSLNRDYSSGNYYASVVKVDEPQNANGLTIYRGRISAINDEKDFTIESFSQLQGTQWNYYNTPKTFNMTFGTRMLNDEGVLNVRDFKGYGEDNYLKRTVYVVADGTNAVLVSTAPYGISNIKGTVYATDGTKLELHNVQSYSPATYTWVSGANASIGVLDNSIIIKNSKIINAADIENGATVRVMKKDTGSTGEAYIIFVE